MISWPFGGATFGKSDVPLLKRKDKLVWKSVDWGDIQLMISGCVFSRGKCGTFLVWACRSPTLEERFSPGQGLGAGCSNTVPTPTRGWAGKPHWLNLLHGGGSGKWKITQDWTKRFICSHGDTQRGRAPPRTTQPGGRTHRGAAVEGELALLSLGTQHG